MSLLEDSRPLLGRSNADLQDVEFARPARFRSAVSRFIVEPIIFLLSLCFAVQSNVVPQYIYYRVGQKYNLSANSSVLSKCDPSLANASKTATYIMTQKAQQEASRWNSAASICSVLPMIAVALTLGDLSDKLGRRTPFVVAVCGEIIRTVAIMVIMHYGLPLWTYLVALVVTGAFGGVSSMFACSFAHLADLTSQQERRRATRFTICAVLFGFTIGLVDLTAGWTIRSYGYLVTYAAILAALIIVLLIVVLFLVDMRPIVPVARSSSNGCLVSFTKQFKHFRLIYFGPSTDSFVMCAGIVVILFYGTQNMGIEAIKTLFLTDFPFCWDSVNLGYVSSLSGVGVAVGTVFTVIFLERFLRPMSMVILGILSTLISKVLMAIAVEDTMVYVSTASGLFSMLPFPMTRAVLSFLTPEELQGALMASFGIAENVCQLLGTVVFSEIYRASVESLRQLALIVAAGFCAIATAIAVAIAVHLRRSDRSDIATANKPREHVQ